ncbi:hypothetical protein MKY80_19475 [Lysinibacillus sp. FSL R5-0849]|uniref:hypothetical protein n=1 Tax=Lysinibacillus sp. FSL R5-0849 TaxID=2921660 RepID=UPI00315A05F6
MTTIDIERIRADLKRFKEEKNAADMERGYCILDQPSYKPVVSDVWAQEAYYKHLSEIKMSLAEYATLLLDAKEVVVVGEHPKLLEWQALLNIARECKDRSLSLRCFFISQIFLKAAIEGDERFEYAKLADLIDKEINDYPYHVYYKERYDDGYGEGTQGTFDEYYEIKREELASWLIEH